MQKQQAMAESSGTTASAPPSTPIAPSAPPSYEEAIANSPHSSAHSGPYSAGSPQVPMPMPSPHPHTFSPVPVPSLPLAQQFPPQPAYVPPLPTVVLPRPVVAPRRNIPTTTEVRIVQPSWALGPNPIKMKCPSCHTDVKTSTVSDHQPCAHVCCIVLCLIGCCLCSCLPYCMSSFLSIHHFCPNCKTYVGTWKG